MQQVFHEIALKTNGQGFYDFTKKTMNWLNNQEIENITLVCSANDNI